MSNRNRISNVLVGVVVGALLILGSVVALFWNEGRAIQTAQSLSEGADAVISVEATGLDPELDGELIHVVGQLDSDAVLSDPEFPVEVEALVLRREVEMFQWHEEERRGEDAQYTYHTDWADRVIDSGSFTQPAGHENPSEMPFQNHELRAGDVTLEDLQLSETFIRQLDQFSQIPLDDGILEELPAELRGEAQLTGNQLYLGANPSDPQVGDLRVVFASVQPHEASLIGAQQGDLLASYSTRAGNDLALVSAGRHSAQEMFDQAMAENVALTWILRGGGLLAMFIGFVMVFGPIGFVARFIPILGGLIVGAKKLVSVGLTLFLGGGVIALSWLIHRPLIGVPLLLLFGGLAVAAFVAAARATAGERSEVAAQA